MRLRQPITAVIVASVFAGPWSVSPAVAAAGPAPIRTGAAIAPTGPTAAIAPNATDAYRAPLVGQPVIVGPFQAPLTVYGAGHRGVDLNSVPDRVVRAAAAGTITFAGAVAGRGVVVIAHPDGVQTEYEPLLPQVQRGDVVTGGQVIGQVSGQHGDCAVDACLHWGAQRNGTYFDPLSLLRRLGVVHLIKSVP